MSASTYDELATHVGHDIECVSYADGENVAVECNDCSEVIVDFDRPERRFLRPWEKVEDFPGAVPWVDPIEAVNTPGAHYIDGDGEEWVVGEGGTDYPNVEGSGR